MSQENIREVLAEDNLRREFFDKQADKIEYYESLLRDLEEVFKEFVRVAPPVLVERDKNKLLLAKKIFKDNFEAYSVLLNHEIEFISRRAMSLKAYDKEIAKNDIQFMKKVETKCEAGALEMIRDYYAKMVSYPDMDIRNAMSKELEAFLQ